jgi:tripartite-type tricarboxylate transporter receptor subunit TctC
VKDFDVSSFYGVAAPAGTPADVTARMETALQTVLKMADVSQAMESRGADVGLLSASVMGTFMGADAAKWKRVADFAKITLG